MKRSFLFILPALLSFQGALSRPQDSDFDFAKLPEHESHFYQERQDTNVEEAAPAYYDYDYPSAPSSGSEAVNKVGQGNIIEVLQQFGHGQLVNYLAKAQLSEEMKSGGPFTVFTPSPTVFQQDGIQEYFDSLSDEELTSLLLNHVISGQVSSQEINDGDVLNSVHGAELKFGVDPDDGHKFIGVEDGVAIIEDSDYQASNGIIHVIDWILFLPDSNEANQTDSS